jgi:hypothetical protein
MQDLLHHIDLDYYRSAQLLIARAEIALSRQQPSPVARNEQQCKSSDVEARPVDDSPEKL